MVFWYGAPISDGLDPVSGMNPFDRDAAVARRHQRIVEHTTEAPNTAEMKAASQRLWDIAREQRRQREVTRTHMNLVARQNQALTGQFGSLAHRDNRFLRDLLIADYIVVVEAWNKIYSIWKVWMELGRDRPEERENFEIFLKTDNLNLYQFRSNSKKYISKT